ncbi:unnamed protein product [Gordionus sp. m RMFG-2023]|uniref:tetraspanin-33-like n=1 Tax=Gordionus sp. m RMFG-2023 TaxID=3053472 RepID=UPI0030E40665
MAIHHNSKYGKYRQRRPYTYYTTYDPISKCVKYTLFFFNFLFWLCGCLFAAVGMYAFIEKEKILRDAIDILFDPAILLMLAGTLVFVLTFLGCLGSLRENICMLKSFAYILFTLFLLLLILGGLIFFSFYSDSKMRIVHTPNEILLKAVQRYRDDDDLRNFIDNIQIKFECCGVGTNGFRDWSMNPYFNCTPENLSVEQCGVPSSCCKRIENIQDNVMCGFHTVDKTETEIKDKIYTSGCLKAISKWIEEHAILLGGTVMAILIPLLLAIFLSLRLAAQIEEQRLRWLEYPHF